MEMSAADNKKLLEKIEQLQKEKVSPSKINHVPIASGDNNNGKKMVYYALVEMEYT